jgi:hypothetical protein
MNSKNIWMPIFVLALSNYAVAQEIQITKTEEDNPVLHPLNLNQKEKVHHAEPLYIDLIRDLGARKGEKEWNIGLGLTDNLQYDSYEALIEYEWAPMDRLGLEIELPFTFYTQTQPANDRQMPANQLNSLKLAAQYSFFVNEAIATSMAFGYINEFELSNFNEFGDPWIKGNVYNPFLVVAKRWGHNFHSLVYTGPKVVQEFTSTEVHALYDVNTSFHFMITSTRNFIGVEFNKTFLAEDFDMTIRPQMRLGVADNLLVGIIAGFPVSRENERLSAFVRLIWEPGNRRH